MMEIDKKLTINFYYENISSEEELLENVQCHQKEFEECNNQFNVKKFDAEVSTNISLFVTKYDDGDCDEFDCDENDYDGDCDENEYDCDEDDDNFNCNDDEDNDNDDEFYSMRREEKYSDEDNCMEYENVKKAEEVEGELCYDERDGELINVITIRALQFITQASLFCAPQNIAFCDNRDDSKYLHEDIIYRKVQAFI
ncbi:protein PFC0760c-like [Ruditapes philippinarum]|uniref:protein PFC0760c-like n=1 Tax=Ruditapes philippinarum TaxID=129788 RepID=UPI00295B5983|nr:protein PFC0760c-like [Ruditapes philippinarum]